MQALYKFTDNDIEQLKIAKEALQRIDCWAIACDICPLYVGNRCISNRLGFIVQDAERRLHHDN